MKELQGSEQKFQRKLFIVRIAMTQGVQTASLRSGVPVRTISRWKCAFKRYGAMSLHEKSRRPIRSPKRKDRGGVLAQALINLHDNEPGLSKVEILAHLKTIPSEDAPTMSWLRRASQRMGLTRKRKFKINTHTKRYEIPTPGYLQIDTKIVEKEGETGEKLIQFTAIDECSRVRYLEGSLTKGAAAATKFLKRAVAYYESIGVKVLRAQTDHGTEFTLPENAQTMASYARGDTDEAMFTTECDRLGIIHRLIKIRTPQLNGKVERSHRTDGERFYSRFTFRDDHALNHALQTLWMPEYNEKRPHSSLGGLTPMAFLKKRLQEIKNHEEMEKTDEKIAA